MEALSALRVRSLGLFAGLGGITLSAGAAFGGESPVDVSMDWNHGSATLTFEDLYAESDSTWTGPDGLLYMAGERGTVPGGRGNSDWGLQWTVSTNLNARGGSESVTADLNVFNNTLQTQTYWVLTTKNGVSLGPASITDGSVSATVFDLSADGAEMSNISSGPFAGDPIYESLIDGASHMSMWPDGYSLTAAANSNAADSDSFDNLAGPIVNDSIAVRLKIEVSPLDSVNIIGTLEASPIPTPAALSALGLFGLAAGRRRRRR